MCFFHAIRNERFVCVGYQDYSGDVLEINHQIRHGKKCCCQYQDGNVYKGVWMDLFFFKLGRVKYHCIESQSLAGPFFLGKMQGKGLISQTVYIFNKTCLLNIQSHAQEKYGMPRTSFLCKESFSTIDQMGLGLFTD